MSKLMSHRWVILVVLFTAALSTRLLPLSISQYPFNNDAITECTIASDIIESQHLEYPSDRFYADSHSVIAPLYNVLLAFSSSFIAVSPLQVAQIVAAIASVVTVLVCYLLALEISNDFRGSITAALILVLLGTFVFLTGSAWKESIGVALLVLLIYVYAHRTHKRMLVLEVILLAMLPAVHHLVTGVAYLTVWFLTIWSVSFAVSNGGVKRRHLLDIGIISVLSLCAFAYYDLSSLDRLDLITESSSYVPMILVFFGLVGLAYVMQKRKRHFRFTAAPVAAIVIFTLAVWNHHFPIFPYAGETPSYVLILFAVMSLIVGAGWHGLEVLTRSSSGLRAIPVGLLMAVLTILFYSFVVETGLSSHWIIYRTFDFADIPLALGVAASVGALCKKPKRQLMLVSVVLIATAISFPFGFATGPLEGIRHDTQGYEVDALQWVDDFGNEELELQSDERIAYNARALFNFVKGPNLPRTLTEYEAPSRLWMNLLLEEWFSVGVNDYPRGHPVLDETFCRNVIDASNVLYVGGPQDNQAIVFILSKYGSDSLL